MFLFSTFVEKSLVKNHELFLIFGNITRATQKNLTEEARNALRY